MFLKLLGIDASIVNVTGGAVALGHPLGYENKMMVIHVKF
jgi:acetyl-CoA acetyltransferase